MNENCFFDWLTDSGEDETSWEKPLHNFLSKIIWFVAPLGIFLSFLAYTVMQDQYENHSKIEFSWLSKDRIGTIKKGLGDAVQAVDIFGNVLETGVNQAVFDHLGRSFLEKTNGIKELMLVLKIPDKEFDSFLEKGFSQSDSFSMHDNTKMYKPITISGIDYYFPVFLRKSFFQFFPDGYDVAKDDILRSLVLNADRLQRTTIGFAKEHVQSDMRSKFFIVVPLTSGCNDIAKFVSGFVIGLFDLEEIVQKAISLLEPRGIQILILDQQKNREERFLGVYYSRLEAQPEDPVTAHNWQEWLKRQSFVMQETITIADQVLIINTIPIKNVLTGEEFPHAPWIIFIGGTLLSILIFLFLYYAVHNLIEKSRLYAELEHSSTKLRILFNQYPDTIMTVSRDGSVLLTNRSEVHSMACILELQQPELHDWYTQALRKVYETGEIDQFQFPVTESEWCEVRFVPIRTDGKVAEVMILSSDISEKYKQQEQAIRYSRLASLGILAAGMAHEINNPNNTIHFNIAALLKSWPDLSAVLQHYRQEHGEYSIGGVDVLRAIEMLPKLLESIKGNAHRISCIVDNLKHMARQDKGDFSHVVDFNKVIRNVISILQHPIKRHTDCFEVILPTELPFLVGNALQLEQLFINLLINALNALPSRDKGVKITVKLSEDERSAIIQVIDEGIGMSEQEMAKMFLPFYTTRSDQGGIGMGLSIVWDIVQHHDGKIQTTSKPGSGTVITVQLPVSTAQGV